MLIRDWFFRLYGDVAHDWRFITVMALIMLLLCWLAAEGLIAVARKTEAWVRSRIERRRWNRSTGPMAPRDPRACLDTTTRADGERYPEQLPAPGVADLRVTRSARRALWAQIEAALAEAARNRRDA